MRTMLLASAAFSVMCGPAFCQVPVTDTASELQLVKETLQQVKQYALQGQQYFAEAESDAQLLQIVASTIQNPSLGGALGLINAAGYGNDLPVNPYSLMSLTSGYSMGFGGLSGKLAALGGLSTGSYDQNHIYTCTDNSWACQQQQRGAYGLAGTSGIAQSAYQDLRNHAPILQSLQQRSMTATTPAERENLQLAVQTENVWNQNTLAQIEAAKMQSDADHGSLAQQDQEQMSKNIDDTISRIP